MNKLTFSSYYSLPGIISDRLFSVFDTSNNGYLNANELITGMKTLFCGSYESSSKFIFDFYDFDKDSYITREDIRTVLSYVTLSGISTNTIESQGYLARVHSQEELHALLENSFEGIKENKINYKQFLNIIENKASDIYIFILLFLLDKKPFTKAGINEYEKQINKGVKSPTRKRERQNSTYLASPSTVNNSSFSPSLIFIRESKKRRTVEINPNDIDKAKLLNGGKRDRGKRFTVKSGTSVSLFLKQKMQENNQEKNSEPEIMETNASIVPVHRKTKTNLKNLQSQNSHKEEDSNNMKYNDLKLLPAYKQNTVSSGVGKSSGSKVEKSETASLMSGEGSSAKTAVNMKELDGEVKEFNENDDNQLIFENSDEDEEEEDVVKHEGYLYKLIEGKKLRKLWFKLLHKDLYFFKNDKETQHKGMHNLSGVFLREEKPQIFNNQKFFVFSIIYPKKERVYFVDNESQYKIWIAKLKTATEYTNLTDIYEVSMKLGNGKFGLVKLGINKQTGKKVAIKILTKKDMELDDLELVRTEVEILRVCQHPNIIHLYEVFENVDYFYIIMEYCAGGDLFSYLEKRHFRLTEEKACRIIHKMCTALFYIHSYGIVHRDIKPENVLMTSNEETADIRILDFGLSKILGPNEFCTEPYGTLSYVAPEVLLEKPYNKAVDMWSLGVTTYLILSGALPFDHPQDDREIARQTIHDPVPFKGSVWRNISQEGIDFIKRLLTKNPDERMTVKDALEHEWIKKFSNKNNQRKLNSSSSIFKLYSSTEDN